MGMPYDHGIAGTVSSGAALEAAAAGGHDGVVQVGDINSHLVYTDSPIHVCVMLSL